MQRESVRVRRVNLMTFAEPDVIPRPSNVIEKLGDTIFTPNCRLRLTLSLCVSTVAESSVVMRIESPSD